MPHHHTPANHDQDVFNVIEIDRALKGMHYPATKDELIQYAEQQHASADVVGQIHALPGDHYDSEVAVTTAFSHSQSQGKNKSMP